MHRNFNIDKLDAEEQSDGSYLNKYGDVCWYNEAGQRHREDGPAVIYNDGEVEWLLNGEYHTFESWCAALNKSDEVKMLLRLSYE
jgi:hypothetical protein